MSQARKSWIALLAAGTVAGLLFAQPAMADATAGYAPPVAAGPQSVKYPMDAQRSGQEGTVTVQVFVTRTGSIHMTRVTHTSGNERLDNAAVESVLGWHFKPATQDGSPVNGWATVQVVYKAPMPSGQ